MIVDKYEHLKSLVSVNDLLAVIVGQPPEPFAITDDKSAHDAPGADQTHTLDGMQAVDESTRALELPALSRGPGSRFHTRAGLILTLLQHTPEVDDTVAWYGWSFHIDAMDGFRIASVTLPRLASNGHCRA